MSAVFSVLALSLLAAAAPASALSAFAHAWSAVSSYSAKLTMHETAGSAVQDRTYDYSFSKPNSATIAITGGPGRGGRVVWSGGDSVIGSPPGLLHGVKVRLSIHDGRVTTLRGDTVEMASFGWVLQHLQTTKGRLSEAKATPVGDTPVTELDLQVADPAANGGISEERVLISDRTELPVRVRRYAGTQLVKEVDYAMANAR
jgi:outer membrane lipoprotein-sorting protein